MQHIKKDMATGEGSHLGFTHAFAIGVGFLTCLFLDIISNAALDLFCDSALSKTGFWKLFISDMNVVGL